MILYKYRNWDDNYHKSILKDNQFYLAPPSSFNDPFDCRIFAQFVDLTQNELEEYAKKIVQGSNLPVDQEQLIINKIKNDPEAHQANFERVSTDNFDKFLGIISFSTKWDNLLMWSHYGNMHKGFCIGLDEEKLQAEFKFGASGLVNYPTNKKYPKISPLTDGDNSSFFTTVYNKSIDWIYENEYRFASIKRPNGFKKEDRIMTFSNESIKEVILGLNSSEETDNEILEICAERKIPLYKAKKKRFHFDIEKEKVRY